MRASRPLDLEAYNTLFALAGSLLGVQAAGKEPPPEAEAKIRLSRVSAFCTESLLTFRAGKNPRGFVPTVVDMAQNCLFVGSGDRPFVAMEANDFADGTPHDFLVWKGENNAYSNFEKMLAIRPDEGQSFYSMNNRSWMDYYKEADAKFPAAPFRLTSLASRSLWTAVPEFFLPAAELRDELLPFGVALESLPRLAPSKKDAQPVH
jgi:hypothetical protein